MTLSTMHFTRRITEHAALCMFLAILPGTVIPARAQDAPQSLDGVRTEAERGGYRLTTTDELWNFYSNDEVEKLLVDTRQGWEFRAGHIKGAVSFPMEPTWLSRWKSRKALRTLLGPDREKLLVFY